MWILNVKFNASPRNFLSLVILSAVFNLSVLGFWHVFMLINIKINNTINITVYCRVISPHTFNPPPPLPARYKPIYHLPVNKNKYIRLKASF